MQKHARDVQEVSARARLALGGQTGAVGEPVPVCALLLAQSGRQAQQEPVSDASASPSTCWGCSVHFKQRMKLT